MIRVVKIGGKVVEDDAKLLAFCKDFARLEGPKILVHGGGVMASKLQEDLGLKPQMVEGRRVTDQRTLKIVTMVYAGWCNKHIVATLQSLGCNAIGLAGCDASIIKAQKREPKILSDGQTRQDYGYVGDVTSNSINIQSIEQLLKLGLVPIICAINHDGSGNLLNTNADTVASSISSAFGAELLYCFEKNGVLCRLDDDSSVIPLINPEIFERLKAEGIVDAGMIPKLDNSFAALRQGAVSVVIKNSTELLTDLGTKLQL